MIFTSSLLYTTAKGTWLVSSVHFFPSGFPVMVVMALPSRSSSDFCPRLTPKAEPRLLTIIPTVLPQCQHMALSLMGNEYFFFPSRELILIPMGGCSISPFISLCPQLAQVIALSIWVRILGPEMDSEKSHNHITSSAFSLECLGWTFWQTQAVLYFRAIEIFLSPPPILVL